MYNSIEYSDNYSKTFGILWQYRRDELAVDDNGAITDFNEDNAYTNSFKINEKKPPGQMAQSWSMAQKMLK